MTPPLCCVKFMLTLPFWAGKKLMTLPWIPPAHPPLLKNECSLTDEIKSFKRDGFPQNFANRDRNYQASVQPYHRRYTGEFTSQDPASYRCGVVGHKACVCPNQSHDYYTSGPWRKANCKSLLRRSNTSKWTTILYLPKSSTILMKIVIQICFEVFAHPKSLDTREI